MLVQTLEWLLSCAIGAAGQGTALRIRCRRHAGGMALWIALDPVDEDSAARLAEPGPALQPMAAPPARDATQASPQTGWYLWLRRRPRP